MSGIENPPAFPRDERHMGHNGMTLRDWFAGQALTVIIADLGQDRNESLVGHISYWAARGAYIYADAMLAERAK